MKDQPGAVRKAAPRKPKKAAPRKAAAKKAAAKKVPRKAVVPVDPVAAALAQAEVEYNRAYKANQARIKAKSWREAAAAGGFPSEGAAKMAVSAMLRRAAEERSAEHRQEALQLSIDRHEGLIAAHWYLATVKKQADSAMIVLRAQAQIDKLERNGETEGISATRTIIITGSEEEFIAGMKAVVENRAKNRVIEGFAVQGLPDTPVDPPA